MSRYRVISALGAGTSGTRRGPHEKGHFPPLLSAYGSADAGSGLRVPNLTAPAGALPVNTAGGNLAEGFVHGIGLVLEAVRQIRGTSANQVPGSAISLAARRPGGPAGQHDRLRLSGYGLTFRPRRSWLVRRPSARIIGPARRAGPPPPPRLPRARQN